MARLGISSSAKLVDDKEALNKLVILRDLPKARYATRPALTIYPAKGTRKPAVFSHLDVYKMVETVGHTLRENGVRPKTMVAMALPNGLEAVVTFFALQWVNAIAVSVDPKLDTAKTATLLQSVGAAILITPHVDEEDRADDANYQSMESLASQLGALSWHVKYTINEGAVLDTHSKPYGPPAWHGGSSDYTADPTEVSTYTFSPGTEVPLVLPLSHQNVAAAAKAFAVTYDLFDKDFTAESSSKTVLTESLSDVQGILQLVTTLYVGGKIVIPPGGELVPSELWKYVETDSINWVSFDKPQFLELYESAKTNPVPEDKLSFIRVCGGGFLDADEQDSYEELLGAPVLRSYGPPEASGLVTSETFIEDLEGTLGKAVTGCSVAIFATGAERTMLGPNEEGDIAVHGDNVTLGFLNDDVETAESVVKVNTDAGVVDWFCTGDRGELDEEGNLRLTGSARGIRAEERRKRQEEREREAELAAKAAAEEEQSSRSLAAAAVPVALEQPVEPAEPTEDGRERLNRNWDQATRSVDPTDDAASATPGQVRRPDWMESEDEPQRQMRRLTPEEIQSVGPDWCIVTPFQGIPMDDDSVVVMRRIDSTEQGASTVVDSTDTDAISPVDSAVANAVTAVDSAGSLGERDLAPVVAAAAVAPAAAVAVASRGLSSETIETQATASVESQLSITRLESQPSITRLESPSASEMILTDSAGKSVKKKVVKFGGVTYEYFYTDEDDEEMLLELLAEKSAEEEKKRTVKLPPKYRGGFYTEEVEESSHLIQVRVMTAKEAGQFRKALEDEYEAKLEEEKKRLKEEYDALLAAALRQQEEMFHKEFAAKQEKITEDFEKQYKSFDVAEQEQKQAVQNRLLAESRARESIYTELLEAKGEKYSAEAVAILQKKRAEDRTEVLEAVQSVKADLERGIREKLERERETAAAAIAVPAVSETDEVAEEPAEEPAEEEEEAEPSAARAVPDVSTLGQRSESGVMLALDDPEVLKELSPTLDEEFVTKVKALQEEERQLFRSSAVGAPNNASVSVLRTEEDKALNDKMSYTHIVRVVEALDDSQQKLGERLLYSNQQEAFKARELAEALAEDRAEREILTAQVTTQAFEQTTAPVLNRANMQALEATALEAAASAEDGRVATFEATEAARMATEQTERAKLAAEAAAGAAIATSEASSRALMVAETSANRPPLRKETVYREVLPEQVESKTVKKKTISVDLRMVDAALKKHPSVLDARAFTTPNRKTGCEINAVVQLKKGARASESWLKQHCTQTLPLTMLPRKFFYMTKPIPPGRKALAWNPDLQTFKSAVDGRAPAYNYIPPRRVAKPPANPAPPAAAI